MSNPFEDILNSKKSSISSENQANAKRLRTSHDLYQGIHKYVKPIVKKFSKAIGAEYFYHIVDDSELPKRFASYPPLKQIQLLSDERPLWVVTNKKTYIKPDYCNDESERIILIYWNEISDIFSVIYHRGRKGRTIWDGDRYIGTSYDWEKIVEKQTNSSNKQDLIDILHDLYQEQKEDIDHHFYN